MPHRPWLAQPGIELFLLANGRYRAMAGIDHRIIGQGEKYALDAIEQLRLVPAWQIMAADAPVKEDIAIENYAFVRLVEADVTGRMAWRMEHLEPQLADFQFIAVREFNIG